MLCIASVRIGRARQSFWAVWDRAAQRLLERTAIGRGGVTQIAGAARVVDRAVEIELTLEEQAGVETICPTGRSYDLRGVDGLHFEPEAERKRHENLLMIRSSYRQPFGTFRGQLPGGLRLAEGYGVMEQHDAWW
jgi:Domain of unknown function (DUF2804), C-terminal